MIVAIDIDGVLRDFFGALIKQFKKDYPELSDKIPQTEDEITQWTLEKFWPEEWTDEKLSEYWGKTRANEIYGDADPYPGAVEAFKKWKEYCTENNHKLIIITSARKPLVQKANWKWLRNHGFDKLADEIHMRRDKYNVPGDVLLDDYTRNIKEWTAVKSTTFSGRRIGVALDRPWNKEWQLSRVRDYDEFLTYLQTIDEFYKKSEK